MNFLNPIMLGALAAAAVPIIIHLIHRRKPKPRAFAAIELLLKSVERVEKRWRLKRFLLLAMRVAILAAFALAAARPLLGEVSAELSGPKAAEHVAVVIDASLSMRAQPGGGVSAFERACEQAQALVDRMGPEDRATLVVAEARPRLLVPRPTADKAELSRVLGELEPSWAYADLAGAVTAAAEALRAPTTSDPSQAAAAAEPAGPAPRGRVILLSDLAGHGIRAAADLSLADGDEAALDVIDVLDGVDASARDNRGIAAIAIDPVAGRGPRAVEAKIKVRAYVADSDRGGAAVPTDVTLRDGAGVELVAGAVDVVPAGVVEKSLIHAFAEPGYAPLSVALPPDTLAEDDVRYGVADVRRAIRMLIVDGSPSGVPKESEAYYLEAALAAGAPDQPPPRVITADDLSREDLEGVYDVIVLAGVPSFAPSDGPRLAGFVEAGGGLWITATESLDTTLYSSELARLLPRPLRGLKLLGAVGSSEALPFDKPLVDHPILSVFGGEAQGGLLSARTRGYLLLEPSGNKPWRVLLSYGDGQPALVEADAGKGHVILLTTSIDRDLTDLPIQPAFVPLVRRTILHLGGALARPPEQETLVGEARTLAAPENTTTLVVTTPRGEAVDVDVGAAFPTTQEPGHYTVELAIAGGARERHPALDFAVNVDPRESDLRPLGVEEASAVLRGTADQTATGRLAALARLGKGTLDDPDALPPLLLALMALAFVIEGLLTYERRTPPSGPSLGSRA